MKSCPTCGMAAEDRASFCPCCGTSFVVSQPTPPPTPIPTEPSPKPVVSPALPFFEEKEKKGGHALPIVILSVLATLTVGLSALWLTGGLEAMLNRDATPEKTHTEETKQPTVQSLPAVAATYDGGEITTEQYLAYLYLEFENLYFNQGLYQYAPYGMDPWEQTFPYGEEGEELLLSDYIIRAAQDNIRRQIVLQQMMEDNGVQWIAEDEAEIDESLSSLEKDAFIDLGFDNNAYGYALKNANLNERSTFYGLYGKGGARAVDELTLRQYFVTNYLSYKMISIPLTDAGGKALDVNSEAYEEILAKMSHYQTLCQESGFDAVYALHTGEAAEHARVDVDASHMDPMLAQAVRAVRIGDTAIVEFTETTTPYIALIQRLDIYDTNELFENSVEEILYTTCYEAFDSEVSEAVKRLAIVFDDKVVAEGKPEEFAMILENR